MNGRHLLPGAGFVLLLLGLASEPGIWAQAPANPDANPEVLTRGPVHEGFALAPSTEAKASVVVAKQPPAPIPEEPPEQKPEGADVRWISGYWSWDDDRSDFIWISGAWRDFPPEREWVPGYWTQTTAGWQWVSGFWQVETQTEVRYLPEPPASVDNGPSTPAPAADSAYVAGVWVYGDSGYRWRPGFWIRQQPNWVWTPAHYNWTPSGYVFIDGGWDYPIARRGLLFAPIWVRGWQPNWVYRPNYLVYETALLTSLFVRPGVGRYYFGDYYEPRYAQRGFVSWVDYHPYRGGYDPLYSYYRWQHRDNNRWDTDLRAVYDGRRRGDIPRPATTLVQQQQVIQNVQKNTNVNNTNVVNNLTLVSALNQVDKSRVKLEAVSNEDLAAQRQNAKHRDNVVNERRKVEVAGNAKVGVDGKGPDAPKVAKLDLPKAPATQKKGAGVKAPPAPETPRVDEKTTPKVDPKAKVEQKPEPKVDPKGKVETKPEPKVDPKGKVEQKPEPKADPKGKVEQKPEPKAEPKGKTPEPAPKPEPKPLPKQEQKPEPKPVPKAEPQPEPKPAPKQEPKLEPKPAPKQVEQPQPKPEPKLPTPEKPAVPPPQPTPKVPATPEPPAPKAPTVTPQPKLPVPDPTPQPRPVPEPPAPKAAPPAPPPPPPQPKAAPPAPPPPAPKAAPPAPPPAPKAAPPVPPAPAPKDKGKDKDVLFEEPHLLDVR